MSKYLILVLCIILTIPGNLCSLSKEKEKEVLIDFLWGDVLSLPQSKRPKIALVLGGGGARGLAHIGVLKVLEQESIPIDLVIGTSVGSIVGVLYCAGMSIKEIESLGENTGWNTLTNISTAALVKLLMAESLLSNKKMERYLSKFLGDKRFEDLDIPFVCIATDVHTGEKIIFKEGDVLTAVRASSTIPGLFSPVEYRHRFLVDGGLVDNLPTDVAKMMGADIIIAVPLEADFSKYKLDNVLQILNQAIYIQGLVLSNELSKSADVLIKPMIKDITTFELWRSKEAIDSGEKAARNAIENVKSIIINKTFDMTNKNKD
ncbi:MAG: patatin-like phospholipase family protein [bacterium]